MKTKSNLNIFIFLIGTIGLLWTIQSCSSKEDEFSFPPRVYDEQAYLREIEAADNLFSLNLIRSKYTVDLKKTERVANALQEKWDLLTRKTEQEGKIIGKPCKEVELLSFDFEKIGPDRFRLFFLFHVLQQFDEKHGINIRGQVANIALLPEEYRERGYMKWHFNPLPPTKYWKKGEYVVIGHDIIAPDLPFRLRMNFDTSEGRYGTQIPLGRMRKLEDLSLTP